MRSLRFVSAFDIYASFHFHDAHRPETLEQFPALQEVNLNEAMYTLVAGEPVYSGFFAFRRLIWNSPLLWVLIPIFYFPTASFFGPRIYSWIARHRSSLSVVTQKCAVFRHAPLPDSQLTEDNSSQP